MCPKAVPEVDTQLLNKTLHIVAKPIVPVYLNSKVGNVCDLSSGLKSLSKLTIESRWYTVCEATP